MTRTAGAGASDGEQLGAYEAKRLQRVRENQQLLAALGIQRLAPPKRARTKRVADTADGERADGDQARPALRRSSRISDVAKVRASQVPARAEHKALRRIPAPRPLRATHLDVDVPVVDLSVDAGPCASGDAPGEAKPARLHVSSQQLALDISSFHSRWLGNQIWPKGKHAVMQGACPSHRPRFSKLSGVQAWRNAVVLFVNVQGGAATYDNVFHEVATNHADEGTSSSAVYFQWFAQQRQHLESPVIKRLLQAQRGDASLRVEDASYYDACRRSPHEEDGEATSAPEPVLLFIRHVDGPYIYCGRLGYLGFRSGSSPLEFRWQLLDVAALAWDKIKALVDASSDHVDGAAVVVEEGASA